MRLPPWLKWRVLCVTRPPVEGVGAADVGGVRVVIVTMVVVVVR